MTISQASIDELFGGSIGAADAGESAANESQAGPQGRHSEPAAQPAPDIRRILGLTVPVTVSLAERYMSIESILAIRVGTIIEFDVPFDAELTLYAGNRPIGKGHAVKGGENFGLRVTRIDTVSDRIEALGAGQSSP